MAIARPENARYNSFQEFMSFSKEKDNHPSTTNLYSVVFSTPRMMLQGSGNVSSTKMQVENTDLGLLTDYYAKSVNLPSKQVTTGQVSNVGSAFKYATNTSFSQININFLISRSQYTRNWFERWTQMMSPDSEQYTRYYDDYVCPELFVYKWERGGGDYVYTDPKMLRALREAGDDYLLARKYELTACWRIANVFPYNIGSIQLDNEKAKTMTMTVGFYYERYRFYTKERFNDSGIVAQRTVPAQRDNVTTPETPRNESQYVRNPRFLLDQRQQLSGTFLPANNIS